jgi:hypothetical protein
MNSIAMNNASNSGSIAFTVTQQADGFYVCEMTLSPEQPNKPSKRFHGQSQKHAISIALEDLARKFRDEAETEQNIGWQDVERSPSGENILKHYHVILHYDRIAEDESKFEAMHNTIMGNTVVENANITVIQIDPSLPVEPIDKY